MRRARENARPQLEKSPRWRRKIRAAPGTAGKAPARARTAGNSRSPAAARTRARRGNQGQTTFFSSFFSPRCHHAPSRLAEADRRMALARAAGALDHLVAVLDESPRFAARQLERRLAALRELEQRAGRVRRRAGDGSRAD